MSGGKTLEDLIKEHKDTDDQQQQPMEVDRHETTEEKKQREARLRAFQARTSNPRTINDAKLKVEKASPYKSSGGTRENMMEGRARALLNKKNQLEESILKKEMQEKKNLEKQKELEEEAKLYRTESQIERANKMIDRLGDPNRNQGVGEDSEEELDQPDPFLELQE